MAKFYCFPTLLAGKKKKAKEPIRAANGSQDDENGELQVKPAKLVEFSDNNYMKEATFNVQVPLVDGSKDDKNGSKDDKNGSILFDEKFLRKTTIEVQGSHESTSMSDQKVTGVSCFGGVEGAYEGGDEHDETSSLRRDFSDFDLQAQADTKGDLISNEPEISYNSSKNTTNSDNGVSELIQSGHVSDPGIGRTASFCGSPKLKRSCSNIETRSTARQLLSPSKSLSDNDLRNMKGKAREEVSFGVQNSPLSARSSCSADNIMLKKRSSSQVLPSRSRKLWWKLFLWSHRNLHKSWVSKPKRLFPTSENSNQRGGYTSDTLEPNHSSNKQLSKDEENQWVAFLMEASPLDRVNAWVNTLDDVVNHDDDAEEEDEVQTQDFAFVSHEVGESSRKNYVRGGQHIPEEVIQANNIIQSLNSLSSGAHICGMGLKALPAISAFSSLRSVNLSNNFIVHVTPGALPKGLHTLDLSRNKITTIEGLRELTRLRVLNLSYNRISRIGHGLSNCTLIKELYLAGNKISNVEGLHRLLKLNLLDLSFNKITTAKCLGQLVANYNSLLALNLLGNPIQSNISDDQLRKTVSGLLPNLAFLNKQSIKPQRATEVVTDSIARAALGDGRRSSRRRMVRWVSQGSGSSSVRGRIGEGSSHRGRSGSKSRHRSKSRH